MSDPKASDLKAREANAGDLKAATAARYQSRKGFKYPSEDEPFVRRLGSALLANWSALPPELRAKILADAVTAWDREYNIPALAQKLEIFVKRYPDRMG